jgi:hypothetical protein
MGISAASQGMVRRFTAVQIGPHFFIERQRGGYWQANLETDWGNDVSKSTVFCRPATALDLIDAHTRYPVAGDLPNLFSWSYSRDALYRHCPRAYYYHYYGSWNGWDRGSPAPVRRLYLLKNLTSIERWTGTLVNDAIKAALVRRIDGRQVTRSGLVAKMRQRARRDFGDSRRGRFQDQPGKLTGFQEHYYQEPIPPSAWAAAWERAEQALLTFLDSPLYIQFSQQPPDGLLEIRTLESFALMGHTVWVQPDLITREPKTITIYDWKTGEPDTAEEERQMGIYGIFARRHWPDWSDLQLKGVTVYLAEYGFKTHDLTMDRLAAIQTEVENSIYRLRSLLSDQEANLAERDRFPLIDDLAVCRRCRFRETCDRQ